MERESYTLKDVVRILSPDGDEEARARIARQVRHWTMLDLLSPEGPKHTGTGVSRRYDADEIRKAAILLELNRYHLPITVFSGTDDDWCPVDSSRWQQAIEGKRSIFLQLGWSRESVTLQIYEDQPKHNVLTPRPDAERLLPLSAVVINLSRLFARLRM